MKVTVKGFVFWKKGYQEEGVFELLPWDCREWGETNNAGRVFVKEHTTEIEVPDDFDPRQKQVASPHLAERASPLAQAKAAISKATGETA